MHVETGGDAPLLVDAAVVTVGVSVMVALMLTDSPGLVAFNGDKCPAVHFAFPVLVEDGDCTKLDGIGGFGNIAVVVAFFRGVGPNRHVFLHADGFGVFRPRAVC